MNRSAARRRARTLVTLAVLTVACLLVAAPAFADPPGPTHYQSTITGVTNLDGEPVDLDLEVVGGDSYLVVRAPAGTSIEVPGYDGEPYIRIDADGAVHVNERSPARWLNDARYGAMDVEVPASADSGAAPSWVVAASSGGEYAWHDHRIHFMSPTLPSSVDPAAGTPQPVMDWEVPLVVDGEPVVITGELAWLPGPSPVLPVGAAVLAVAALAALVVRRPDAVVALIAGGIVITGAVGLSMSLGLPAGSDTEPALLVLPAMAAVALLGGIALHRRGDRRGAWLRDAAGLPIGVWAVLLIGTLTRPVAPGPLPVGALRLVVALTLGIGVAALVGLVRRLLRDTRLDDAAAAIAAESGTR